MSVTPRSEIREWIRAQLDAGTSRDDITFMAIQHFLDRADIVAELVSTAVKAEASKVLGVEPRYRKNGHHTPKQIEAVQRDVERQLATLPAESPLAPLSPSIDRTRSANILLDLAKMTKPEVLNMASKFDSDAQRNDELAALCRAIAAELRDGQRVNQRFTQDDLFRLKGRITTVAKVSVYMGDRQVALTERTN